jgi:hypothetical protein
MKSKAARMLIVGLCCLAICLGCGGDAARIEAPANPSPLPDPGTRISTGPVEAAPVTGSGPTRSLQND